MTRRRDKPTGGGGARHPNSIANLVRAPAAPAGNGRAVSHGGYAQVARARLDAKARDVFDALAADAPLRDPDGGLPAHDATQVTLLAEVLVRLNDVGAHLRDFGLFDAKTRQLRPAVELESKLRREAADYLDSLGMTPRSRARLGVDVARTRDLAQEWAVATAEEETPGGDG